MLKYEAFKLINTSDSVNILSEFQKKTLHCKYLDDECNFEKDFSIFTNTEYLYCFKYNSDRTKVKTTSMPGQLNGLQFSYFIGDSQLLTNKRGLRVFIHSDSRLYPTQYIDIQPGVEANIALKRSVYQLLPYPYTNCISDLTANTISQTDVMKYMFTNLGVITYSHGLCQDLVFSLSLDRTCNCTDKSFLISDLPRICHTSDQIDCMNAFRASFSDDVKSCPIGQLHHLYFYILKVNLFHNIISLNCF